MTTVPTVTMQDLEFEHAELLPSRETLFFLFSNQSFNRQVAILSGNSVASGNNIALINGGNQVSYVTSVGNNISQGY
jgi:hypothetical protein